MYFTTFFTGCIDTMLPLDKNKAAMPESFADIPNCRAMIDCTDFYLHTPRKDFEAEAVSYSNYKERDSLLSI